MVETIDIDMEYDNPFSLTAREAAEKMVAKVSADPGAWSEGVALTKLDVMGRAASDEAEANFKAAMLEVLNAKLRQAGLKGITTDEWKRISALKSGAWGEGVAAKKDRIVKAVGEACAVTYDVAEEVRKTAKGLPGSAANKARMTLYFDKRVAAKKARGT